MGPALTTLLAEQTGGGGKLIDWQTFAFQVGNFLVLVALLRIFLYKRVIKAMDQRQRKIASHFEAAEQKDAEAGKRAEEIERQKQELEQNRQSLLNAAKAEAEKLRKQLTDAARQDVEAQSTRWREDLDRQKGSFLEAMRRLTGEQVCAAARRALTDLGDAEVERAVAGVLTRRLAEMPEAERRQLAAAAAGEGNRLLATTAWELPDEDRRRIAEAVARHVASDVKVEFQTDADRPCGAELTAGHQRVAWTVDEYIDGLREALAEVIEEKSRPPAKPKAVDRPPDGKPKGDENGKPGEDGPADG